MITCWNLSQGEKTSRSTIPVPGSVHVLAVANHFGTPAVYSSPERVGIVVGMRHSARIIHPCPQIPSAGGGNAYCICYGVRLSGVGSIPCIGVRIDQLSHQRTQTIICAHGHVAGQHSRIGGYPKTSACWFSGRVDSDCHAFAGCGTFIISDQGCQCVGSQPNICPHKAVRLSGVLA